jgi:hypothetical protein
VARAGRQGHRISAPPPCAGRETPLADSGRCGVPEVHASRDAWRRQVRASAVRVQWDPERDLHLRPVPEQRSLQLGLSGEAVRPYVEDWTVRLTDVTPLAHRVHALLPPEREYS